jgi:hypothetical protein
MGIDFSGDADAATTSYCGTTSFRNVRVADSLRVDSNADMAEEVEQVRDVRCSETFWRRKVGPRKILSTYDFRTWREQLRTKEV